MLQLPQIQSPLKGTASAGRGDTDKASDNGDAFGDLLDSVTQGELPQEVKADLVQQVQDGVPVSQVLAELVDRLEDLEQVSLAPGMAPVLQTLAPQIEIPEQMVGAGPAGPRPLAGNPQQLLADADAAAAEALPELEPGEVPQGDQLLGKHKALLAGRVAALEVPAAPTAAVTATQSAAQRVMELAGVMAPQANNANAADGPDLQQPLIAPRVGDAQWGQALAQRVVWMVGQEQQSAELRLNPAHLGPMEVKLTLHHDQATLSMVASNAAVRDAVEQALPRLRDMLGQQDIQLAQVDVGYRQSHPDGQAANGQGGGRPGQDGTGGTSDGVAAGTPETTEMPARGQRLGLVDAYV